MTFESLTEGGQRRCRVVRQVVQVRGPTTVKAQLVGDGCQLDRRHC